MTTSGKMIYTHEDMKELSEVTTEAWKAIAWAAVGIATLCYCLVLMFITEYGNEYFRYVGFFSMGLFGIWCMGKYTWIRTVRFGRIK